MANALGGDSTATAKNGYRYVSARIRQAFAPPHSKRFWILLCAIFSIPVAAGATAATSKMAWPLHKIAQRETQSTAHDGTSQNFAPPASHNSKEEEAHTNSSAAQSHNSTTITVNGQDIPVPPNGTSHSVINQSTGSETVVNTESHTNNDQSTTSTSTTINITSQADGNYPP